MKCRKIFFVLYVIISASFIYLISSADVNICVNSKTGQKECCQDYKNVRGICQACIGSFGKKCTVPCPYGYYGHGCRKLCNCSDKQICDRKMGCLNGKTCIGFSGINCTVPCPYGYYGHECRGRCHCSDKQACDNEKGCLNVANARKDFTEKPDRRDNLYTVTITVGGFLIVIVFGTVGYLLLRLKKINGNITMKSAPSGMACTDQQEQGECIYTDVRESRMIETENTVVNQHKCNTLQIPQLDNILEMETCRSLPRQHPKKWRQQSIHASSNGLDGYGNHETYNHLQLKKNCTLPAKSSAIVNNYCSTKANPSKYLHNSMNVKSDLYSKNDGCDDPTPEESTTLPSKGNPQSKYFRPYSSVKPLAHQGCVPTELEQRC